MRFNSLRPGNCLYSPLNKDRGVSVFPLFTFHFYMVISFVTLLKKAVFHVQRMFLYSIIALFNVIFVRKPLFKSSIGAVNV